AAALGRIDLGFPVGTIKGKQLVPAPELAFHFARHPQLPTYAVDRTTALRLLKKEAPPLPDLPRGWQLITHRELGLLWVKGLGNRYNNYYPSPWRIRMALPKGS
ncbi:MAG: RNA methyltransferase, partial [Bacteroidota bacterium]